MNVMNVMNVWKSDTFMPYPTERKERLNVMNVVQTCFDREARHMPNESTTSMTLLGREFVTSRHEISNQFSTKSPRESQRSSEILWDLL